jgi:putative transposase
MSASGYVDWKACSGPAQWLSDDQLLALIRSVHAESKQAYGSPRITEELKGRGIPIFRPVKAGCIWPS